MRTGWRGRVGALVAIVVVGATIAYFATRGSGQPQVSANVLPQLDGSTLLAVYVDCSKISAVAYFADNPCQTFVLLKDNRFQSAADLLAAEARHLTDAGWHHSAPQPTDYDQGEALARPSESWVAPDRRACAYVTTVAAGIATEARGLFPYDPYNQPDGVLAFYRGATAAKADQTLWVRLRPPNQGGHCVG